MLKIRYRQAGKIYTDSVETKSDMTTEDIQELVKYRLNIIQKTTSEKIELVRITV